MDVTNIIFLFNLETTAKAAIHEINKVIPTIIEAIFGSEIK